ncbi:hypothetical protein Agub_g14180, partial [Astrephomene gubernaculifera]
VVSSFTLEGELVRRAKQYVVHTQLPYRVVAAELTPSRADLVMWCHVAGQPGDADSFGYFSVHVLNVEAGLKPNTPRIDIYDHSRGACAPAYALTPRVPSLGSEYLIAGLGCGLLGWYSLATGALVRAVRLPGVQQQSRYFASLSLFTLSPSLDCPSAGRSYLAAAPAASPAALLFLLDDSLGVSQQVALVAALGPPRGVAPPPPQLLRPPEPPSREVEPARPERWRDVRQVQFSSGPPQARVITPATPSWTKDYEEEEQRREAREREARERERQQQELEQQRLQREWERRELERAKRQRERQQRAKR